MLKDVTSQLLAEIRKKAALSRGDIVAMTHLAGSGHPGGSMSSVDIYTLLYHVIDMEHDKVVVSHGHTSPAVYSALARSGQFDPKLVIKGFRRVGSVFEGHVEPTVPGVPWGTGNLGQGLSVAAGYAVGGRVKNEDMHCYVIMGDGEQQKGQIAEARRFIRKYNLNNITVFIDNNMLQISGNRAEVMPQDLKLEYESNGFKVLEIDGHDLKAIYAAVKTANEDKDNPYMVLAHTTMGKGVSFMENKEGYHGAPVNADEMQKALDELELEWPFEDLKALRDEPIDENIPEHSWPFPAIQAGTPTLYGADKQTDNRSAFGNALLDVGRVNADANIVVFDCDLAGSVKTAAFGREFPDKFFQAGIAEHNVAVMAGSLSSQNVVSVFAGFGMFGVDETYNQQRLNAVNNAHMKLFCTHIGIDVGEDGKTHQCIDYLGLMKNLEGYKIIIPVDPNETDLATRWSLSTPGNCFVGMGRSKLAVITDENGTEYFKGRKFNYGEAYHFRPGDKATVFALGAMSANALAAWDILAAKGIKVEVVGVSAPFGLDATEVRDAAAKGPVFVVEDHLEISGLAAHIAYLAATSGIAVDLEPVGIKGFPPSGPSKACLKCFGLDADSLAMRIENRLK